MKAILNKEIIFLDEQHLSFSNRGFKYGDGLFETIAIVNGDPRFLESHLKRLRKGADLLGIDYVDSLDDQIIANQVELIKKENNITGQAILKIILWREADGLYTPSTNESSVLITIKNHNSKKLNIVQRAGFSAKTINFPSPISGLKTLSALKYVVAGVEKTEMNLEEIIILDHQGHISEALSSNIFWIKEGIYYTPPLSTGCIEGVMRNWLINRLIEDGYKVIEKLASPFEFKESESIFTTNASGIRHIQTIEGNKFVIDSVSQKLVESIS